MDCFSILLTSNFVPPLKKGYSTVRTRLTCATSIISITEFVLVKGTECLFILILTLISLVLSCDAIRIRGSVLIQVDSPLGLVDVGARISSSSSFSPGSTGQSKHAWVVKSKD